MQSFLRSLTHKKFLIPFGIVALVVIVGVAIIGKPSSDTGEIIIVDQGDVIEDVRVTGQVVPAASVDLAFEQTGTVNRLPVSVGDQVTRGQLLASLNNATLNAQLREAEARVDQRQARLDEIIRGTRPEEIAKIQEELATDEQDLLHEYELARNTLREAYTTAEIALRVTVQDLFGEETYNFYDLQLECATGDERDVVNLQRYASEDMLNEWSTRLEILDTISLATQEQLFTDALNWSKSFLGMLDEIIGLLTTYCALYDNEYDTRRTSAVSARTDMVSVVDDITTRAQAIADTKASIREKQESLNLAQAGSTAEEIAQARADLEQAQAQAANIRAQIESRILRAPFTGVVSVVTVEEGETAIANTTIISVISQADFEITIEVPEIDIAKIMLGDTSSIDLDAYGSDVVFDAVVTNINPAETIVDGVPVYEVTMQFTQSDERIRSGMTANATIVTDERRDVVRLPLRAFERTETGTMAYVMQGEEIIERVIVLGLQGTNGFVEILDGITAGDQIQVPVLTQ